MPLAAQMRAVLWVVLCLVRRLSLARLLLRPTITDVWVEEDILKQVLGEYSLRTERDRSKVAG